MKPAQIVGKVAAVVLLMVLTLAFMYPWQAGWSDAHAWLWMACVAALVVLVSVTVTRFKQRQGRTNSPGALADRHRLDKSERPLRLNLRRGCLHGAIGLVFGAVIGFVGIVSGWWQMASVLGALGFLTGIARPALDTMVRMKLNKDHQ